MRFLHNEVEFLRAAIEIDLSVIVFLKVEISISLYPVLCDILYHLLNMS